MMPPKIRSMVPTSDVMDTMFLVSRNDDGSWPVYSIRDAAMVETARAAKRCADALDALNDVLRSRIDAARKR
jgi:hypothetical protein